MESLSERLKKGRISKRLSLEEVERELYIRRSYLEALEGGNYDRIPSEVYLKGFLRNYARFLGISPDEATAQYEQEKLAKLEEPVKRQRTVRRERAAERELPPKKKPWGCIATSVVLVIVIILAIWQGPFLWQKTKGLFMGGQNGTIKVEVISDQNVWLQVKVDGNLKMEGFVQGGSQHTWQGNEEIQLVAGKGQAVKVRYNGVDQGRLSESNEITQKIFRAPGVN